MSTFTTILHPTDFSEAAGPALRMAYQLARDYSARLVLLNVVEPPVYFGELGVGFNAPEEHRSLAEERIASLLEPDPKVAIEPRVVEGMAAAEIVREARERQCDLIVICSHGRTGIGRVLMGSVAEEVARKASCPVLIVRTHHEIAATRAAHEAG